MRILLALLLGTLALLAPAKLAAHTLPGSNLQVVADLSETELTVELSAETSLVPPLDDVRFENGENFPALEERRGRLEEFFREKCPVVIDGVKVAPVMKELQFRRMENEMNLGQTSNFVMGYLIMTYSTKTKPRKIDFTWGVFLPSSAAQLYQPDPDAPWLDPLTVDSIFHAFGKLDVMRFSPKEPQFIWHAPEPLLSQEAAARIAAGKSIMPKRLLPLAWPLAGLIAVVTLGLAVKRRRLGTRIAPLPAGAAALLTAVFAFQSRLVLTFPAEPSKLTADEAKARFLDLHQNIYRAFDYDKDETIYDTLAESVSGGLLDRVYQEVKKSLILKEEGGAECRVQKLDYLSSSATERPEGPGFSIDCQWRVHGLVNHWGHTHQRINEYRATYQLALDAGQWRITDVTVHQESAVDPSKAATSSP